MTISLTRSAILATGFAVIMAGMTMASGATADQATTLTGCRFETYEPYETPRCGFRSALSPPTPSGRFAISVVVGVSKEVDTLA